MAQLEVLIFPHDNLRIVAKEVTVFDDKLKQFVEDMFETMYAYKGIGLAATQVNSQQRIFVMDIEGEQKKQYTIINPIIISQSGESSYEEGCLSIPSYHETITRSEKVTIEYQDENGDKHTLEADGLLATCIQHEIDHLNGKLFVDYISSLKRERITAKLLKDKKIKEREEKSKKKTNNKKK